MSTASHATEHTQTHGATGHASAAAPEAPATPAPLTVLVYSDDPQTREQVLLAIGRRPAADLPRVSYVEYAGADDVVATIDDGGIDLAILDGEAAPTGGIGLCRQLKNEVRECPAILILTGRRDDRWLATWSQADAAVPHPIDAMVLVDTTVELLRTVRGRHSAIRSR